MDVFVVEPSAVKIGGHYFDYVDSFKKELAGRGNSVRMLVGLKADTSIQSSDVIPTFTYTFWDGFPPIKQPRFLPFAALYRPIYRLIRPIAVRLFFNPLIYRISRIAGIKKLLAYWGNIPMGLVIFLENKVLPREKRLHRIIDAGLKVYNFRRKSQKELEQAIARFGIDDPCLFFTTAGENEVAFAARYLLAKPRATAVMMVRRPLFYSKQGARLNEIQARAHKGRFAKEIQKAQKLVGARMVFCTDTPQLTATYNRLGIARFRTLPIPHVIPWKQRRPGGTIRFCYLGDARIEKGFLLLPDLVHSVLQSATAHEIEFFIQCNFNVPGGEPGIARALNKLKMIGDHRVKFRDTPLNRDAYIDEIRRSDIVLLLYDADLYRERSSGILIEAISCGASVVIPTGSWMEAECAPIIAKQTAARLATTVPIIEYDLAESRSSIDSAGLGFIDSGVVVVEANSTGVFSVNTEPSSDVLALRLDSSLVSEVTLLEIKLSCVDVKGRVLRNIRRQHYIFEPPNRRSTAHSHLVNEPAVFDLPPGTATVNVSLINTSSNDAFLRAIQIELRRTTTNVRPTRTVVVYGDETELHQTLLEELFSRREQSHIPVEPELLHGAQIFSDLFQSYSAIAQSEKAGQ